MHGANAIQCIFSPHGIFVIEFLCKLHSQLRSRAERVEVEIEAPRT